MKPLNVALIYRSRSPNDGAETRAKVGLWSYPVPEFTWREYGLGRNFTVRRSDFAGFDVIFHEDWICGVFEGPGGPPIAYWVVDSNTSERRFGVYRRYARQFNAVLVDQDQLGGWPRPAYRLPYAVNDRLFKPLQKTVDVGYYVEPTPERNELGAWLGDFCRGKGYSFDAAHGLPAAGYAAKLGAARIVVHLSTHPQCRTHRLFDALACGACFLTFPLPMVDGDGFTEGEQYLEWRSREELGYLIKSLLDSGTWQTAAAAGHKFVMEHHTWAKRAPKLHRILSRLV